MVGGVAFGANDSYLFFCGEGAQHQFWAGGLPVSLQKHFDDNAVKEIFHAALGPDGSYYMYYRNQADKYQIAFDQLPLELKSWCVKPDGATQPDRDFASLEISLGPNESFFAFDKNGRRYHNLPTGLEAILQAPPSDSLAAGWAPSYLTLGSGASSILRSTLGGGYHALVPTHGLMDFIISPQKPGNVRITLSPSDHNNYVVTALTGTCIGVVPWQASRDFVSFSLKWTTCHPAVTEAEHKVIVDNRQVWINHANTLQQTNAILKSPVRTVQPLSPTVQPLAATVQPAAPKKSTSETFATNLDIANGVISLITGIENLENNQNNQNNQYNQNYQYY